MYVQGHPRYRYFASSSLNLHHHTSMGRVRQEERGTDVATVDHEIQVERFNATEEHQEDRNWHGARICSFLKIL